MPKLLTLQDVKLNFYSANCLGHKCATLQKKWLEGDGYVMKCSAG